jgi:Na+/melibiose symporter-like transporter
MTMIFVTVSVALSKKLGKKNTYILGLFGNALTLIALFFFGHFMGMAFVRVLLILQGMFFGLCLVPPLSMVADTVDFGYLKGGARREGAYFGIFWWGQKLGQALAGVLTGIILESIGYIANVMQPENVLFGIRSFYLISAILYIIATVILCFYPISEKKHMEHCERIAVMEAEHAST